MAEYLEGLGERPRLSRSRYAPDAQPGAPGTLVHRTSDGQTAVFQMQQHRPSGTPQIAQRGEQEVGVGHRVSVVREGRRTGIDQLAQLGEFLTPESPADRTHLAHQHVRPQDRLLEDPGGQGPAIDRGRRVRHADHHDVAAGRRGPCSGGHIFLVLLAGGTQMRVHIDEPGKHRTTPI